MASLDTVQMIIDGLSRGAVVTVIVTLSSLSVALILGFILALIRQFTPWRIVHFLLDSFVEFFRNIPALTHLFILYFGLGSMGIRLDPIPTAIIGLGLVGSAVTSEIFRAGFKSLPKGQMESGLSTGFTPWQVICWILTPQAMRISLPPLGNYAIQLLKDTSIVSAIAAPEIMFYARSMVTSSFETTLIYTLAAIMYLLLSLPLIYAVKRLEKRWEQTT